MCSVSDGYVPQAITVVMVMPQATLVMDSVEAAGKVCSSRVLAVSSHTVIVIATNGERGDGKGSMCMPLFVELCNIVRKINNNTLT